MGYGTVYSHVKLYVQNPFSCKTILDTLNHIWTLAMITLQAK